MARKTEETVKEVAEQKIETAEVAAQETIATEDPDTMGFDGKEGI